MAAVVIDDDDVAILFTVDVAVCFEAVDNMLLVEEEGKDENFKLVDVAGLFLPAAAVVVVKVIVAELVPETTEFGFEVDDFVTATVDLTDFVDKPFAFVDTEAVTWAGIDDTVELFVVVKVVFVDVSVLVVGFVVVAFVVVDDDVVDVVVVVGVVDVVVVEVVVDGVVVVDVVVVGVVVDGVVVVDVVVVDVVVYKQF